MATTKIWGIKGRIDRVIRYAANESKTWNGEYEAAAQFHRTDVKAESGIHAVLQYTADEMKTEKQFWVTGVNCSSDTQIACGQMRKSLSFAARDGYVCFHGYQSFKTGEVTPEEAHHIGVELAKKVWGNRFEVLVSTHLNTRTVHNHFVVAACSFVDQKRYYANQATYAELRRASDEICMEHGLSVIENPQRKKSVPFSERKAAEEGRYTVRGNIRRDIDYAISNNCTFKYFWRDLEHLDYTLEYRGKYLRIRPDSGTKFFRLDKLGDGYTEQDIKDRLQENFRNPSRREFAPFVPQKRPKATGLHALYLYYCYLLGELPKSRPNNKEMFEVMKEDLKKMEKYSKEADLLGNNHIETAEDLSKYTERISAEFKSLAAQRKKLRNTLRRMHSSEEMQPIKDNISVLSERMGKLRQNMKLCEDIAERSGVVECIVNTIEMPREKSWNRSKKIFKGIDI